MCSNGVVRILARSVGPLLVALAVALLPGCSGRRSSPQPSAERTLRGTEILVEVGGYGKFSRGIYCVDPSASDPQLELLIKGASRPIWNPRRDGFAFVEDGHIEVRDRNGFYETISEVGGDRVGPGDPPVQWVPRRGRNRFPTVWVERQWAYGSAADYRHCAAWPNYDSGSQLFGSKDHVQGWQDVYSAKALDVSPRGDVAAVEASPLAPDNLLRSQSKIYMFTEQEAPSLAFRRDELRKGKRLTRLGPASCELEPMCSPDGKWIAFTVVHFDKEYVAPAVCRPDGTGYAEIFPNCARELEAGRGMRRNWLPVVPLRPRSAKGEILSPMVGWGWPHVRPVEWSDDGRYLLLNRSDTVYGTAEVATCRDGKWYVGDVADQGKPGAVALGPSKQRSCLVAYVDMRRTAVLIVDKEKFDMNGRPRQIRQIQMPEGVRIMWLDW